ncbi:gliding motility-associated C-terminal domain-containing protein [Salinimicrobium sp. 3283s]|uniref:T9SS type B sorting domain-containing protein n=1 Tax=Salinimicrobium sp. 3283s TaxID=3114359 RepID=UPI0031E71D5B
MRVPLFFFALFLFSGTLSSYGQEECPELSDSNPADFCYLDDINDLSERTGATNDVVWYRDSALTQRIPSNEFLEDDTTYYAGNADGNCLSPTPVTVTVGTIPAPDSSYGSVFSPYLASENDARTIEDLIEIISPNAGGEIIVYQTEFGTATYANSDELVDGNSYFVGQTSPNSSCNYSYRLAIRYSPDVAPAPIAEDQELCQGATVSDLQATGTSEDTQAFRWYSTATSNPALADNELLVPGTYYVSQIVNDEGNPSPPVESQARTAVNVELQSIEAGEQVGDGIYCQSDIDSRLATTAPQQLVRELFTEQLEAGVPTDGTFADSSINEVISQYQNGVRNFSTTYTVSTELGCEDSVVLSFTIEEDFYAGEDNTTTVLCSSELPPTLDEETTENFLRSLLSEDADANGTFSAQTIAEITAAFNSGDGTGTFSTIYSGGTGECADSAEISVTVLESGNAGDDADLTFCQSEVESLVNDFFTNPTQDPNVFFAQWIGDRDTNGTFSGDPLASIISQYQNESWPIEVSTTYTIGEGTECENTAVISLTVIESETVEDNTATICNADVPVLFQQIPEDVRAYYIDLAGGVEGGIFEPSINELIAQYRQNNIGDFTTTYTVEEGTACENSAVLTVTISNELLANAGDDRTLTFCTTEDPQDLADFISTGAMEDGTFSGDLSQTFDPATVGAGTYNVVYTVDDSSACVITGDQDTADFTITITEGNIVTDNSATICISDVPLLFRQIPRDVRAYYVALAGGTEGGTFEPSIEELINQYRENNVGDFRTVYTVNEGTACEDTAELIVTVIDEQPANAGDLQNQVVCSTDGMIDLSDYLAGSGATMGGTFSGTGVSNGMFDPSTGIDTYTITYSVDDTANCVTQGTEDSETFTIQVLEGIEIEENIISETLCITDVPTDFDAADLETYYLGLLGDLPVTGTFSPSLDALFADFQANPIGTFSTTYSVGSEVCGDSVEVSVTINPLEDAEAGDIQNQVVCFTEGLIDLSDYLAGSGATTGGTFSGTGVSNGMFDPSTGIDTYTITYSVDDTADCVTPGTQDSETFTIQVVEGVDAGADNSTILCNSEVRNLSSSEVRALYLGLLEDGIDRTGSFSPTIQQLIDQYRFQSKFGDFTTTYTVGTGQCTDSAVLTVTVLENPYAGQNATVNLEEDATETVDLFAELGGTPETGGTWTFDGDEVDATFDPATDAEGVYTYTVTSDNGCSASATVTVIVGTQEPECNGENTPAAPTVTPFDGCAASNATVADLEISGEADAVFTVYSDETLQTEVDATQVLTAKTYYVTQTNTTGCVSDATAVTVTLNDVDAPSLVTEPEQLCAGQDLTVGDLEGSVIANGDLVWYTTATGSETVSPSTPLQNGTTLFAAAVDATTGCESSTRTPVQVNLSNCEIVIPEIFSPNGDAINDRFVIQNISSEYPNHMMEIYNRWGEPVYKGQVGKSQGWDGTSSEGSFGSGVLPVGVYFYILNYNDGQTAPIQGRVYLSR